MGYDVDRFVSRPPEDIICVICTQVVENPVSCSQDHLYCQECLEEWLKVSYTCPVDRQTLTTDDVKHVSRPLMSILMSLQIRCVNYMNGCRFVSTVEEQAAHSTICNLEMASSQENYDDQLLKVQEVIRSRKAKRLQAPVVEEEDLDIGPSAPPSQELNILILAETGVGKSTFINAFANYVTFPTLNDAMNATELIGIVPASFIVTADGEDGGDVAYVQKKIVIKQDANEDTTEGESATQATTPYAFNLGRTLVRLIDTPGIGDTRGAKKVYL